MHFFFVGGTWGAPRIAPPPVATPLLLTLSNQHNTSGTSQCRGTTRSYCSSSTSRSKGCDSCSSALDGAKVSIVVAKMHGNIRSINGTNDVMYLSISEDFCVFVLLLV